MNTELLDEYGALCARERELKRASEDFDVFRTGLTEEEALAEVDHFAEYWIAETGSALGPFRIAADLRTRLGRRSPARRSTGGRRWR